MIEELSFELLDDVALAAALGTITPAELPKTLATDLGPLVEFVHAGLAHRLNGWLDLGRHKDLTRAILAGRKWFSDSGAQGFVSMSEITDRYSDWTDFAMRAKRAATGVGFALDDAGQLVAAIGELRGNVEEHSEDPDTGYFAYDATPGRFEFVAADSGIGVLRSLRTHPHYADVQDAGTALNLALSEGVSRHYDDKGRGRGFRPIFIGLANASEHLRFRSGDHTREMARDKEGRLVASTRQKADLPGFFCSVRCAADIRHSGNRLRSKR
ncbi:MULTISPECIES: hypothetical protein [Bradyrhizobium]|uniref:hypothetical protein n=1 Tax=Bradyrhizobium elkanii TaxID=29448 RepID=UPI0027150186|nr:hypothetical protein [Bradyrhizobium elkanii]WLA47004.1 hypothetical protein QIH80_35680 [Bradyrhizobium elkanii]WLB82714.1 hypothetical protein QIH83_09090 [Bradyrhizobium elkanii]